MLKPVSRSKPNVGTPIDISRSAQIRDIEASFGATDGFDLGAMRHPNKPNVTAVEAYEVFPDAEIWANAYDLFRFSERPGTRHPDVRQSSISFHLLRSLPSLSC